MRSFRATAATAALIVVTSAVMFTAAPATAAAGDMTCLGQASATYSPGLTYTTANITVNLTFNLTNCTSVPRPDITSGTESLSFTAPLNCSTLLSSGSGPVATTWNTAEVTTANVTDTAVIVQGLTTVAAQTGTVTAGPFTGDSFTLATTFITAVITLGCLAPGGLTSASGVSTLILA